MPTCLGSGLRRRAAGASAALLAAIALALAGCGSRAGGAAVGGTLTVYASLPFHGVSAAAASAVAAGARLALADRHGRAAGRRVRLVVLDDSSRRGLTWDPALVQANAKRAASDPSTIAYLGELDLGGSAVSVPVTNGAGILQVSPLDGLASLTTPVPGSLATAPERYYPSGRRTFIRLVPNDLLQAQALVRWIAAGGAHRLAIVREERLFAREMASVAAHEASRLRMSVVAVSEPPNPAGAYPALARAVAARRPDALLYLGLGTEGADALLRALRSMLPAAPLFASSALADVGSSRDREAPPVRLLDPVLPSRTGSPVARRVLRRIEAQAGRPVPAEALYGYEAMRVVLGAIGAAGAHPGNRAEVIRAALREGARSSAIGAYRVTATGDVSQTRFAAYLRRGAAFVYRGLREPSGRVR